MKSSHAPRSAGKAWAVGIIAAVAVCLVAWSGISCARKKPGVVALSQPSLGTIVKVTIAKTGTAADEENLRLALARVTALEKILSSYDPQSDLSKLNQRAGEEPVQVSPMLFRAVDIGVTWHGRTQRCFDIAASPVMGMWKQCAKENRLPTAGEMKEAVALAGADRIKLDAQAQTVQLPAGMQINLGGLGKGLCADEVTALLRQRGVTSALVAMSGDIYALGERPDGAAWRVGVQDPRKPDDATAYIIVLALRDKAVSTSGNYQRFVVIDGKKYSHIVDPRTGQTVNNVPSVTVIGPDVVTTDILGTALSVLGLEEGAALVEAMPGVEALFVSYDDVGGIKLRRTSGFAAYEASDSGETDYRK